MKMAIFVAVNNGVHCHLYDPVYSTDIGTYTRSRSIVITFTDQTYLLGHSTMSTDSLRTQPTGQIWRRPARSESNTVAAAYRHTFLGVASSR